MRSQPWAIFIVFCLKENTNALCYDLTDKSIVDFKMADEEPAWKDAARFVAKICRHPNTHSSLFILACTCALTAAALYSGTYYTPTADVIVYCLIYSLWLTICLPWLVKYLDKKTVFLVFGVLVRLFAAEAGVLLWGLVRGHGYFLQRALRLKPLLEPSLLWLAEAGYNLRYGVIVSASVAALLVTFTNFIESCNRGQDKEELSASDGDDLKDTKIQVHLKALKQGEHCVAVGKLDASLFSERTFLADDSSPFEPCRHNHESSQDNSPVLHGINSLLSFTHPNWNKMSTYKDRKLSLRTRSSSCDCTSIRAQKNRPKGVDKMYGRSCQLNEDWNGSSSSNTSLSKGEPVTVKIGKRNRDKGNDLPAKKKYKGFSPVTADEADSNHHPSVHRNAILSSATKTKAKLRPSSSNASFTSTGRDLGKERRGGRGQSLGRSSCPIELKGSPNHSLTRKKMSLRESRTQSPFHGPVTKTGSHFD